MVVVFSSFFFDDWCSVVYILLSYVEQFALNNINITTKCSSLFMSDGALKKLLHQCQFGEKKQIPINFMFNVFTND